MTTNIHSLIVDALVAALEKELVTSNVVPEEMAEIVRGGRLQQDPLKGKAISVLVHIGDPQDETWRDISSASREESLQNRSAWVPAYEIGGGSMWWRRQSVEWQDFYPLRKKLDRDASRDHALAIMGRIERVVSTLNLTGLQDDNGEKAVSILQVWSKQDEQGGPPASFIWRGRLGLQVLTNRPY